MSTDICGQRNGSELPLLKRMSVSSTREIVHLHMREDLSLHSRNPQKMLGMAAHACNPSLGRGAESLKICRLPSLAEMVTSGSVRDSIS